MSGAHTQRGAPGGGSDGGSLEREWTTNKRDDKEPACDVEWNLPLGAENFLTGEPLVSVDYFDLTPSSGISTEDKLLDLKGAIADDGARATRVLIFDTRASRSPFEPRALIAIATVHDDTLRVATARNAVTDTVRYAVQSALGASARHRLRTRENPIDVYLNSE